MKRALFNTCWMAMLMAGLALSVPVHAAKHMGTMDGQKGMGSPHMSGVMRDMSKEMGKMSGQMSKGNLGAETQKQMAGRMKQMSGMMEDMSGMAGKGMMMDADTQKQMDQMRKQMDEMMKGSSTTSPRKH